MGYVGIVDSVIRFSNDTLNLLQTFWVISVWGMFVIKVIRKGRRSDKRERQEEKDETISNFLHVNEFSFLSVCFYLYDLRSEMENLLSQL